MPENHWSTGTKRLVLASVLVIAAVLVYLIWPLLPLLAPAAVLAYLLLPLVDNLSRGRMPRGLAAAIVFLVLIMFIVTIPIVVIPAIASSAQKVDLNASAHSVTDNLREMVKGMRTVVIGGYPVDLSGVIDPLQQQVLGGENRGDLPDLSLLLGAVTGGGAPSAISTVLGALISGLITLAVAFYLVVDAPAIKRGAWSFIPEPSQAELKVLHSRLNRIWQSFFRGQLLVALSVAAMTTTGALIVGLPGALWLGLIAGVLEVVPNFGPVIAAIPALAVALTQGSTWLPVSPPAFTLIVAGLYLIIQETENNIFVPRIIGNAVGLPPVIVLLGAIIGATVAGLLGVFLAAPTIASIALFARYIFNKLLDKPPFEDLRAVTPEMIEKAKEVVAAKQAADQAEKAGAVEEAVVDETSASVDEAQLDRAADEAQGVDPNPVDGREREARAAGAQSLHRDGR